MKKITWIILTLPLTGIAFGQGSLTPPGAPGPIMKTLAQIEPRTAISNAPYTITNSGSYYLTTNIFTSTHGVVIRASRVTLDLMGFSITGDRGSGDYGIHVDGSTNAMVRDITVRGGMIKLFDRGVLCESMQNSRLHDLMISSNRGFGIEFEGAFSQCNGNSITDCNISDNGNGVGIHFDGASGQCNQNSIADCTISGNGSYGIWLDGSTSGQCNGNTLVGCTIIDNGLAGIYGVLLFGSGGQCNGNTVNDCIIGGSGSYGIHLEGSSGQCEGNVMTHCNVYKNTDRGISLASTAMRNRIENNHVSATTGAEPEGISSEGSKNVFLQNTSFGQAINFNIVAPDIYGPVVTNRGALSASGEANHPWANFSR